MFGGVAPKGLRAKRTLSGRGGPPAPGTYAHELRTHPLVRRAEVRWEGGVSADGKVCLFPGVPAWKGRGVSDASVASTVRLIVYDGDEVVRGQDTESRR